MKYEMRRPCDLCPFSRNGLRLSAARAEELGGQIVDRAGRAGRGFFICHKTGRDVDGEIVAKDENTHHCAGALIFAEKQGAPTQMMRIAERLGAYDRRGLDMAADVFDSLRAMIAANRRRLRNARPTRAPSPPEKQPSASDKRNG